jgi:hypothetical protein
MDKKEDVQEFEKLEQQLHSFLTEISELSKKKPSDPLNKFKLKFINGALDRLNKLLGNDRPFPDFELFDVRVGDSNFGLSRPIQAKKPRLSAGLGSFLTPDS